MHQYILRQIIATMYIYFIFEWRHPIPEDMELISIELGKKKTYLTFQLS